MAKTKKPTDGAKNPRKPRAKKAPKLAIDGDAIDLPMVTHDQEYAPANDANSIQGAKITTNTETNTTKEDGTDSHQPDSTLKDGTQAENHSEATTQSETGTSDGDAGDSGTTRSITQLDSDTSQGITGDVSTPITSPNFQGANTQRKSNQAVNRQQREGTQETVNGPDNGLDRQSTTQTETGSDEQKTGDELLSVAETVAAYGVDSLESLPSARARAGETKGQCRERLRQEARTAGMTRRDAISYAGRMVEQVWIAPFEPEPIAEVPPEPEVSTVVDIPVEVEAVSTVVDIQPVPPADLGVSGLGDIPQDWPQLPANAQLQVEIAWVSANRLRVRSGHGVDLSRALSPAPSYSALSWLETSILFPSKFADISVKATASQDDEKEHIRREKLSIEEIRGLLAEMLEG